MGHIWPIVLKGLKGQILRLEKYEGDDWHYTYCYAVTAQYRISPSTLIFSHVFQKALFAGAGVGVVH